MNHHARILIGMIIGHRLHRSCLPSIVASVLLAAGSWLAAQAFGQGADVPVLRPYQIKSDPPTKLPQIVPVVHGADLFIAWQAWGADQKASAKVYVHKVSLTRLAEGKLALVREIASAGHLVGFTIDSAGGDHVLTARNENVPITGDPKFVNEVHKTWRQDVVAVASLGKTIDLNSNKFTDLPFYGLMNSGTGRLAASNNALAAVFSRRRFTPGDNLVHQEGSVMVVGTKWDVATRKAGNTAAHVFDHRLIADGDGFLALHQVDTYPYAGLIAERIAAGEQSPLTRCSVFACPTFGNSVFFELGGVAAEKDGYPVLFTATRNTQPVSRDNVNEMSKQAWDLALVYLLRGFEKLPRSKNPYDTLGVLATDYAESQEFAVDNYTWNFATSKYDRKEPRQIKRRVLWLTEHEAKTRAASAKLIGLDAGQYIAIWEEHGGANPIARAMHLTIAGRSPAKRVTKGKPVELPGVRLHRGDDAIAITIDKKPHAAWVTAGQGNDHLLLHTLDDQLRYKGFPLKVE